MPAKMMKLMPLPMPRSVMSSPIHITRTVPAVSDVICVSVVEAGQVEAGMTTPFCWLEKQGQVAVRLQEAPCGTVR